MVCEYLRFHEKNNYNKKELKAMGTEEDSTNGEHEHLTRAEIVVSGDVQEAGYRGTILPMARRFKLRGFVENLPDGTVKIIAEGAREKIKGFIEVIDIQNDVIEVEKIDVKFSEGTGEFKWFQVKYSDMVSEIFQGFGTAKSYFDKIGGKIDRVGEKVDGVGEKVDRVAELVVQGNRELKDELSQFRQESNANFQGLDEKYHTVSDELKGIRKALEKRLAVEEEKVKYSAGKKKTGDGD